MTQIAQDILSHEGGYVKDPDDPGGATNHGVTVHTMRRLGIDLNNDGTVDARDVQLLSMERARTIFIDHYYYALAHGRRASRKYAKRRDGGKGGWITRAKDFIAAKYHLTRAQHEKRTASWA